MTNVILTFSEISGGYNAIICDLWGCLHNGVESFPEALKALEKFKSSNGKIVLVTNAPRPIANVEFQIAKLGIKENWNIKHRVAKQRSRAEGVGVHG